MITLQEALHLVSFAKGVNGDWQVVCVHGNIYGSVRGDVKKHVFGEVFGTIAGRNWTWVETPKDRLKRLIKQEADYAQTLEAFNQLEDNND